MNEEYLDASCIDAFDEPELTGEYDDDVQQTPEPAGDDSLVTNEPPALKEPEDDFTTEVLKLKGISDPNKIKFEDEKSGAIVEKSWDELSRTELLNILTQDGNPETDLDDDEIKLINDIRNSKMSINDYIQAIQQQAVEQAQASQPKIYQIDKLGDDELYALDIIEKVGEENITDEELQEYVSKAKENEALYTKTVEALRKQYKALEDENILKALEAQTAQEEESYLNFSNTILNEIQGFNSIAGQEIELSTEEMNDLANFILNRDDGGITEFGKMMNDPKTFTTVAFWALKGQDIMNELQEEIKNAYQRGYNEGKNPKPTTTQTKVVFLPRNTLPLQPTKQNTTIDTVAAIGGYDESYLN